MRVDSACSIHNEDCVSGIANRLAAGSVHLTVTSPPFEDLFSYSGKAEDVGNNGATIDIREGRFALNMRFVIEQLFRVHAPGTNCCVHIQQLLAHVVHHGFMGRRDFRGAMVDLFRAGGWNFVGEVAIPKCPQTMAQRLNLHSLQFKTGYARSSTKWAMAPNDYVLVFQKPGDVAVPVRPLRHKRNPGGWLTEKDWILWARGVWEIDQMDVLDSARNQKAMNGLKEVANEKHVCPLQLECIRRLVLLYSNPAGVHQESLVLDPFMGIGSTAAVCVELGRNVVGFELKESYHRAALNNVKLIRRKMQQTPSGSAGFVGLFDSLSTEDEPERLPEYADPLEVDADGLLPCGHDASQVAPNIGCEACDSGAKPARKTRRKS